MSNHLVSIIMPAYNAENTIAQSIMSVINQTYHEWELIIIDDGSTDNTPRLITQFLQKDTRIKAFSMTNNSGVSKARNYAISLANGKWIAFLDSDDLWKKNKLEVQINDLISRNGQFSFTGSSFTDGKDRVKKSILRVPTTVEYRQLLKQNIISCSSVVIERNLICSHPMEEGDMHEDFATWLKILKAGTIAYGIDEPLLIYRLTSSSKSGNKIKAAKMTYRVYRHIGIPIWGAAYYMIFYIFKSIMKYRKLCKS